MFDFFEEWLTTGEDYLLFMEDDYDLSLMNKWHFTWDEFMSRVPYDWDSIQLGFESPDIIPFIFIQLNHNTHWVLLYLIEIMWRS